MNLRFSNPKSSGADMVFISFVVIFVIFGLVMLMSASSEGARSAFNDSAYYVKHQILSGLIPGIIGFLLGYFIYYRIWEKLAPYILITGIILLVLVLIPHVGVTLKGGTRWINLGTFSFQPGEIMKLTFFIYLSAWISKNIQRGKNFLEGLAPFTILIGLVMSLLLLQPATSMAGLIFFTSLFVYFTSGAKIRFLAALVLIACLGVIGLFSFKSYRTARLDTFVNAASDPQGKGYHIAQAQLAIGSGGLFGVGFGKSTTKYYLPEPMGDSIFAVISEELGFVGAGALLIAFLAFLWRGLKIARDSSDTFARYLATSFMCMFGLQAFVNIGAISGVIPMTGVPLPFISYGGTALAVFLTMCGIIANISKYRR
ncbi:MAG: putative peptidoglycan glycosyltransferase FtsW [bacterium]|nr:putative peptidoglycan glycosyltransferase FtsW [Candidatus Jorgensenbacteria bacterium]